MIKCDYQQEKARDSPGFINMKFINMNFEILCTF